jgi:hypothetical protein
VTLGPTLNQPTVTSLGTGPYLRLRAQLASQASYNVAAVAEFAQSLNSLSVASTANYANGTPANWVLDIPDLTAAGYDPTWGLKSGSSVDWEVTAASGSVLPFFGATPVDGTSLVVGVVGSSSTAQPVRAALFGSRTASVIVLRASSTSTNAFEHERIDRAPWPPS